MEQDKEHKERNKGGRPKKEATEKLKYRVAVKMAAADYFRLLTRAYEAGVPPSEYMSRIHPPALRHGEQSQPACAQGKCRRFP